MKHTKNKNSCTKKKNRSSNRGGSSKRGGSRKKGSRTKSSRKRGGSPGLDKLGYGWDGSNKKTWPGMKSNKNAITQSNHLKVSPYGVPVGGVNLPYSTYADKTGNSSKKVPKNKFKLIGGYTYGDNTSTRKNSGRKNSNRRKGSAKKNSSAKNNSSAKRDKKPQSGGFFFEDVKNFGRYLANGVKTRVNGARGISAPDGVMPTDQPYINKNVKVIISDPVDVEGIYSSNSESVAKL